MNSQAKAWKGVSQSSEILTLTASAVLLPCPCFFLQAESSLGRDYVSLPSSALVSAIKYFSALVKHENREGTLKREVCDKKCNRVFWCEEMGHFNYTLLSVTQ